MGIVLNGSLRFAFETSERMCRNKRDKRLNQAAFWVKRKKKKWRSMLIRKMSQKTENICQTLTRDREFSFFSLN